MSKHINQKLKCEHEKDNIHTPDECIYSLTKEQRITTHKFCTECAITLRIERDKKLQ